MSNTCRPAQADGPNNWQMSSEQRLKFADAFKEVPRHSKLSFLFRPKLLSFRAGFEVTLGMLPDFA